MGNKKVLIIAGIVALLAVVIVAFAAMNANNSSELVDDDTENTGTTNEGDVLVVTPAPTPFGRAGFKITFDPANPYASNLPRSNEPVQPESSFDDYQDAVNSGQIPGQNGEFAQTAGTNPLSFAASIDHTLSTDEFISKNYPNLETLVTATQAGSSGTTSSGAPVDPNDIYVSQTDPNIPNSVPTIAGVDVTLFSTVTNSREDSIRYAKELSLTTAPMDIVFEPRYVTNLTDETNTALLNELKRQALLIQNQIRAVKVPPQYIGMSQAYYKVYGEYAVLIDRQLQLTQVKTKAQYDAAVAAYERDLEPFSLTYAQIGVNAEVMKNQLSQ